MSVVKRLAIVLGTFVVLMGMGIPAANATIYGENCRTQYKGNNPNAHAHEYVCVRIAKDQGKVWAAVQFTDTSDAGYHSITLYQGQVAFWRPAIGNRFVDNNNLNAPSSVNITFLGIKRNQNGQDCRAEEANWFIKWFDGNVSEVFDDGVFGYFSGTVSGC
jgi:hypothetical protein